MKTFGFICGIIMILIPNNGKSQSQDIGFEIGYGKAIIDNYSGWSLYNNEQNPFIKIGGKYEYSPKKAYFKTTCGVSYDRRNVDNSNFNYFKIPFGIDLKFGDKIEFSAGAGLYLSYLFLYHIQSDYLEHIDNITRFQFGWYPNFGIKYELNDKYLIKIMVKYNIDATKMHERKGYSPGGAGYEIYDKGRDLFTVIGLYYRMTKD
jgi:hypothetical protein